MAADLPDIDETAMSDVSDWSHWPDTFLSNLEQGNKTCMAAIKQESRDQCDNPAAWDANQPLPPTVLAATRVTRPTKIYSMRQWTLRDAPERAGLLTPERWVDGKITWNASRTRLTDAGCVFALLMLSPKERASQLPFDFDRRGDIRRTRVPKPPTVVAVQNNVRFFIAWKDTYIFTGGRNDMGWLLQRKYPKEQSPFNNGWLRAGLVLAPVDVQSSSGAGGLDCTLSNYEPSKPHNIPLTPSETHPPSTWEYGHQVHGVPLRGTEPATATTVLHVERPWGYIPMKKIPGFHPRLKINVMESRLSTWHELERCSGYRVIEWDEIYNESDIDEFDAAEPDNIESDDAVLSPQNKSKDEGKKRKFSDAESNDAVLLPLKNRTSIDIRNNDQQDVRLTPFHSLVVDTMTESGVQSSELIQALRSLCTTKAAIQSSEVAHSFMRQSLSDDERQSVYGMLAPEPWMTDLVNAVGDNDRHRNAVINAISFHRNLRSLEKDIKYPEDNASLEATLFQALLQDLRR
ncbi:hypothetical protein MYU51_009717 [Penicillium brevicompactum]|uniref:uncharacterized protein n=1 Tax=Penicillium brevicompactum TaxID=5074 RepID=UPI00254087E7|nr:uncharacterized protein N7506_000984 [Penicillium brevicompactum]KAJ5347731.1 hypothetical protein N7506_000984 [Penicillium brevicompactum]